jgi:hypothetical protein
MLNWGVMLRDFLWWWAQLVRSLLAGCALVRTRFANPLVVPVGVEARWRVVAKLQHELMQAVPRMLIDDLRLRTPTSEPRTASTLASAAFTAFRVAATGAAVVVGMGLVATVAWEISDAPWTDVLVRSQRRGRASVPR